MEKTSGMKTNILLLLLAIGCLACKSQSKKSIDPKVINLSNEKENADFVDLALDSIYANLLDPRNVSESDYNDVLESWTDFHQNLMTYLKKNDFSWDVPDSTISVFNRIYFSPEGQVQYYAYRILSPELPQSKQKEFAEVLYEFSEEVKLNYIQPQQFAQCGKTRIVNK